jgi:hypothetical protein
VCLKSTKSSARVEEAAIYIVTSVFRVYIVCEGFLISTEEYSKESGLISRLWTRGVIQKRV